MSLTKGNGMKGNEHSVFTQKVVKVTLNSNQTDPWHHVIREVDSIVPQLHLIGYSSSKILPYDLQDQYRYH